MPDSFTPTPRRSRRRRRKIQRSIVLLILFLLLVGVGAYFILNFPNRRRRPSIQWSTPRPSGNTARSLACPAHVAAVILCESSYRPQAVSNVGAMGLMQIMPETGKWIAQKLDVEDIYTDDSLFDPETNIRFGCWFLSYLMEKYDGDMTRTTAAYHAGEGTVKKWLQEEENSPDGVSLSSIPSSVTNNYVKKVLHVMRNTNRSTPRRRKKRLRGLAALTLCLCLLSGCAQQASTPTLSLPVSTPTPEPSPEPTAATSQAPSMTSGEVTMGMVVGTDAAVHPLTCIYTDLVSLNSLVFESLVELDDTLAPGAHAGRPLERQWIHLDLYFAQWHCVSQRRRAHRKRRGGQL